MQLKTIVSELVEIRESLLAKDAPSQAMKLRYDIESVSDLIEKIRESQIRELNYVIGAFIFCILVCSLIAFVILKSNVV